MEPPAILDWARLERRLADDRADYRARGEAPHVVIDGFLDGSWMTSTALVETVRALGRSRAVTEYSYYNTRSAATEGHAALPPAVRALIDELHSARFIAHLEALTGIDGLVADEALTNGGVHFMKPGGYLRLHRDEFIHPDRPTLRRRLNLLLYLNDAWEEAYGGHLELWSRDGSAQLHRILPIANRCVVTAIEENVHGVPGGVRCPEGDMRKTVILWYYTDEGRAVDFEPAVFVSRPDDGLAQKLLVDAESRLFGLYHRVRQRYRGAHRAALAVMQAVGYGRVDRR